MYDYVNSKYDYGLIINGTVIVMLTVAKPGRQGLLFFLSFSSFISLKTVTLHFFLHHIRSQYIHIYTATGVDKYIHIHSSKSHQSSTPTPISISPALRIISSSKFSIFFDQNSPLDSQSDSQVNQIGHLLFTGFMIRSVVCMNKSAARFFSIGCLDLIGIWRRW